MCVENKLFVCLFQDEISVLLVEKEELLHNIISGNQPVFVCEKAVSQFVIAPDIHTLCDISIYSKHYIICKLILSKATKVWSRIYRNFSWHQCCWRDNGTLWSGTRSGASASLCHESKVKEAACRNIVYSIVIMNNHNSLSSTRQLLSWYTMAHNPNMPQVEVPGALHPLWVRCDKSDPCASAWLGVETVYSGNKTSGVKLYTVCCKGNSTHYSCITLWIQSSNFTYKIILCKEKQPSLISQFCRSNKRWNLFYYIGWA